MTASNSASLVAQACASVYEVIMSLIDDPSGKFNLLRFPCKYEAEAAGEAMARKVLGESGRGKGKGVGGKLINKVTGLAYHPKGNKATVLCGIMDMTSRKEDGSGYDWRFRTVGDLLDCSRNVTTLEVSSDFTKFAKVDLTGLPLFPAIEPDEETALSSGLLRCLSIGQKIEALGKAIKYLKDKADKETPMVNGNLSAFYSPAAEGTTLAIIDKATGERIYNVKRVVYRVRLTAQVAVDLLKAYPDWAEYVPAEYVKSGANKGNVKAGTDCVRIKRDNLNMLPVYMAEVKRLKAEYVELYTEVRPYELGVIERARDTEGGTNPQYITIGGTVFELEVNPDTEYDQPLETAAKLASGDWIKTMVPKAGKGRWGLTVDGEEAEEAEAEGEEQEV